MNQQPTNVTITKARLWQLNLPLKHPFASSEGTVTAKPVVLVELTASTGHHGYGEGSAFATPFYTAEFSAGTVTFLKQLALPQVVGRSYQHPRELTAQFTAWKGNEMAKSALDEAIWDLFARAADQPLATYLGTRKPAAEAGIAFGIEANPATLVAKVGQAVTAGYQRVKVKIKPGADLAYLQAVRRAFPHLQLMADANSAYTLADLATLKTLDQLDLIMIEQPLAAGDLVEHAQLQVHLKTPLCLDESIVTLADARAMVSLQAGRVINLKVARVGGITPALQILAFARQNGLGCWIGGMVDGGVGRAVNLAVATLPGITFANDLSASDRFFQEDIITPPITLNKNQVLVPNRPGLGFAINWPIVAKYAQAKSWCLELP